MFDKILIANRGEIACRIIRTARRLGIRTVAVYSAADEAARHVALADEARAIGPAPARDSYLKIDAIVAAALASGAQAVHPGYGFLAENADFAEAVEKAGLVFIGPPAAAIRAMGSKSEAKRLMEAAGVPVVPGYHGAAQEDDAFAVAAGRIGYPLLVKASAGGGGKGMRVVESQGGLAAALASARREAASAFGDSRLLVERYLARPRHIEMQVFADAHGNVIHLFERDCSIQRRHQKVVEEAPAPGLDAKRRAAMGEAAIAAARSIGYRGAGTVEFIMDEDGSFHFMEMNTRLQVEHAVTEMITGQDLVEWQLRVAAGEKLPTLKPALKGHAIEARIYAEDPERDFLPQTGRLSHLRFPPDTSEVRIDSGVRAGDAVTIHYDPMLAKLIVYGPDREAARRRFVSALADCEIAGVATNLAFLQRVAAHPAFAAAELDTGFIERHRTELLPGRSAAPDDVLALAALAVCLDQAGRSRAAARGTEDPHSPWAFADGWRMNDDGHQVIRLKDGEREAAVLVHYVTNGYRIAVAARSLLARGALGPDGALDAELDGVRLHATAVLRDTEIALFVCGAGHRLDLVDPVASAAALEGGEGRLTAPMPGKVVQVLAVAGAKVKRGTPLLLLEAMKMEHAISAPADGVVERMHYQVGDQVEEGAELIEFKAEPAAAS